METLTAERPHLKRWNRPSNWGGKHGVEEQRSEAYVVVGQDRDSDVIDRSNFRVAQRWLEEKAKALAGEDDAWGDWVFVHRDSHWAVGWVESIYVSVDAPDELLDLAEDILAHIAYYPALDEDDWTSLEEEEVRNFWESEPLCSRIQMIQTVNRNHYFTHIPIFAARHDDAPFREDYDGLFDYLRGV